MCGLTVYSNGTWKSRKKGMKGQTGVIKSRHKVEKDKGSQQG